MFYPLHVKLMKKNYINFIIHEALSSFNINIKNLNSCTFFIIEQTHFYKVKSNLKRE